jgi:hypothetical protein
VSPLQLPHRPAPPLQLLARPAPPLELLARPGAALASARLASADPPRPAPSPRSPAPPEFVLAGPDCVFRTRLLLVFLYKDWIAFHFVCRETIAFLFCMKEVCANFKLCSYSHLIRPTKQPMASAFLRWTELPNAVKNLTLTWLGSACMNVDIYSRVTQATKHTLRFVKRLCFFVCHLLRVLLLIDFPTKEHM